MANKAVPYRYHILSIAIVTLVSLVTSLALPPRIFQKYRYRIPVLQATGNPDETDGESALLQAIADLPQPNRDTLAYLVLHLKRVGECRDNKMSISNLAKILGPTVVGYSTADPSNENLMSEVDD
jgi:RhoGAP domain